MKLKVAIAQLKPVLGDFDTNLKLHIDIITKLKDEKVQLAIFPELSLTGYFLKDMVPEIAISLNSEKLTKLKEISKTMSIIVGFVEESPDFRNYNSAAYIEDGQIIHVHRKVYLPTYGMFDEFRHFSSGDKIRAFDTKYGRFAMLLCEDMWHATPPLICVHDGAEVIIALSSSPARGLSIDERMEVTRNWELLNRYCAKVHSCYVIYANRAGYEDGINFWGGSEIILPGGQICGCKAKYHEEDIILYTLDTNEVRRERISSPILRDENLELTIKELNRIIQTRFQRGF